MSFKIVLLSSMLFTIIVLFTISALSVTAKKEEEEENNNNNVFKTGTRAPPLEVRGNKFVNAITGDEIVPNGVNVVGAVYPCIGNYAVLDNPLVTRDPQAYIAALKSWNVNLVRFGMNEDCLLDINMPNANKKYVGKDYMTKLDWYVSLFVENSIYVVMELHWTAPGKQISKGQEPACDADHCEDFWSMVASRYGAKYPNHVMFDLFQEPYLGNNCWYCTDSVWKCWRDGGDDCVGANYTVAGYQNLVDSVRKTGAKNILLLGGLSYANSLEKWLKFKPVDPLNSLVASVHLYAKNICNNILCWESYISRVKKIVPVIAGEIGENDCKNSFIGPLMDWLHMKHISMMGWVYDSYSDCQRGPSLTTNITDPDACTESYGCSLRDFLRKHNKKLN